MTEKKPLVIIAGPTAAGKTGASIALAKAIGGEIISADSAQVYRYMDIGSAKITKEEMQGVPHHLIDVLDPSEEFNVFVFQKFAKEAMRGIYERGHIPILVGGTGFYIRSILYDTAFTENEDDRSYRHMLEEESMQPGGKEKLFEMLRAVDPASCEIMHMNNVKRVIRALEYYHDTGKPISSHNEREKAKESPYDFRFFVLSMDREKLYERIEKRVDLMMAQGLLKEVEMLKNMGLKRELVSMQALGYKQLLSYLDGECTLPEAVDRIKLETRHFAKRQLTWFRHENDTIWVDNERENLLDVYNTWRF